MPPLAGPPGRRDTRGMRRHIPALPALLLATLVLSGGAGCGGDAEVEEDPSISELAVMQGKFEAPPALTPELVERYLAVMERKRAMIEEDGNGKVLTPEGREEAKANKYAAKARGKVLATAQLKAQMELGVNDAELKWVEGRVRAARRPGQDADRATLEPYAADLDAATAGMR